MSSTSRSLFTTTNAIVLGVLVFFGVATPLSISADDRLDHARPMYEDRAEMMWLQYQSIVGTGSGVAGEATSDTPLTVADEDFAPSAGVTVEVTADEPTAPCVRASNTAGDVTEWDCVDTASPPVDPDPEEPVDPVTGS